MTAAKPSATRNALMIARIKAERAAKIAKLASIRAAHSKANKRERP